jgi:hypothetical protein
MQPPAAQVPLPLQIPAATLVHGVPPEANTSAGQLVVKPSHCSTMSQSGSLFGRQTSPVARTRSGGHRLLPATHASGVSQSPAAARQMWPTGMPRQEQSLEHSPAQQLSPIAHVLA